MNQRIVFLLLLGIASVSHASDYVVLQPSAFAHHVERFNATEDETVVNAVETAQTQTIPAMWRLMSGTTHKHYLENFRIAAGLSEGRNRGAPFNDGDFYKWLEAACVMFGLTGKAEQIYGKVSTTQTKGSVNGRIHPRAGDMYYGNRKISKN